MDFEVALPGDKEEKEEDKEPPELTEEDQRLERAKYIQELGDVEGYLESPIDLNISTMTVVELNPLRWYNYNVPPKKIKLTNTGYTVILSAKWQTERPYVVGGPLLGKYAFSQLHFHWGENEMTGSEHYADGSGMAMELHAVHFKADYQSQDAALQFRDGVVILVYLFRLQQFPNPSLEELLSGLASIREAGASTRLTPGDPLTYLLPPFHDDYVAYWGSLTTPGLSIQHRVLWLVCRRPHGIACEQVRQFRTLLNVKEEPLLENCRELQDRQNRNVFHVNPSGNCNETVIMIPADLQTLTIDPIESSVSTKLSSAKLDDEAFEESTVNSKMMLYNQ